LEGDDGGFDIPPIIIPPIVIPPYPDITIPGVTWIPAIAGYNSTAATEIWFSPGVGVPLPGDADAEAGGNSRILSIGDYSEVYISAIVEPESPASGNVFGDIWVYIGDAGGTSYDAYTNGDATDSIDGRGNLLTAIGTVGFVADLGITLSSFTDPIINVYYDRNGNHASDTSTGVINVLGFILSFV